MVVCSYTQFWTSDSAIPALFIMTLFHMLWTVPFAVRCALPIHTIFYSITIIKYIILYDSIIKVLHCDRCIGISSIYSVPSTLVNALWCICTFLLYDIVRIGCEHPDAWTLQRYGYYFIYFDVKWESEWAPVLSISIAGPVEESLPAESKMCYHGLYNRYTSR